MTTGTPFEVVTDHVKKSNDRCFETNMTQFLLSQINKELFSDNIHSVLY